MKSGKEGGTTRGGGAAELKTGAVAGGWSVAV